MRAITLAAVVFVVFTACGSDEATEKSAAPASMTVAQLRASDVDGDGRSLRVDEVVMPEGPGLVVVHRDNGNAPGEIVGDASVGAGVSRPVNVTFDEALSAGRYWVMLHHDRSTPGVLDPGDEPVVVGEDVVARQVEVRLRSQGRRRVDVGFLLHDQVQTLDFAGPWEVFTVWASVSRDLDVHLTTVAAHSGRYRVAGLSDKPDSVGLPAGGVDVLIVPGGNVDVVSRDGDVRRLLIAARDGGALVGGVCNGAVILARHGLLDGVPATTFPGAFDELEAEGVEVRRAVRVVDAGRVITSGAVSSGIDLALHLVERLDSVDVARHIAAYLGYTPNPLR
jgi:putative intracellular protease/amidase